MQVTVYEQRAKIMFELDRAAARAAQHKVIADQLTYTAQLSEQEVQALRGLLRDLENKNKIAVQSSVTGGLDQRARIPWHPVGKGSEVVNRFPERYGKPGEDPTVDMTFKPKISKTR